MSNGDFAVTQDTSNLNTPGLPAMDDFDFLISNEPFDEVAFANFLSAVGDPAQNATSNTDSNTMSNGLPNTTDSEESQPRSSNLNPSAPSFQPYSTSTASQGRALGETSNNNNPAHASDHTESNSDSSQTRAQPRSDDWSIEAIWKSIQPFERSASAGDEESEGEDASQVERETEIMTEDQAEQYFQDLRDDLHTTGDVDELYELDPFAVAEEWISSLNEKLAPYPVDRAEDDLEEMMKPEKVTKTAARICKAMLAESQEPDKDWETKKKNHYLDQQDRTRTKIEAAVDNEHGKKKAFAQAIRLVRHIRDVHTKGIPPLHLRDRNTSKASEKPSVVYWTERDLKCSERCEKVIASVSANKLIGLDVLKGNDRNMTELARCPSQYLWRKKINTFCNEDRQSKLKKGKAAERAELAAQQQESESLMLDAEAGAEVDGQSSTTGDASQEKRKRGPYKKKAARATKAPEPTKKTKRSRATMTEENGDDEDEMVHSTTSKRGRSSVAEGSESPKRKGRGGGRKRNDRKATSNFPDPTPDATTAPFTPAGQQPPAQLPHAMPQPVGLGISYETTNTSPDSIFAVDEGSKDRSINFPDDESTEPSTGVIQPVGNNAEAVLGAANPDDEHSTPHAGQLDEEQDNQQGRDSDELLVGVGSWTDDGQGKSENGEQPEQQTDTTGSPWPSAPDWYKDLDMNDSNYQNEIGDIWDLVDFDGGQ